MALQAHHHHRNSYPAARGFVRLVPFLLSMAAAQDNKFFSKERESVHKKKQEDREEKRVKKHTPKKQAKDYIHEHHQLIVRKNGKKFKSHTQLQREAEDRERLRALKDRERQEAEARAYLAELERQAELRRQDELRQKAAADELRRWRESVIKWADETSLKRWDIDEYD